MWIREASTSVTPARPLLPRVRPSRVASSRPPAPPPTITMRWDVFALWSVKGFAGATPGRGRYNNNERGARAQSATQEEQWTIGRGPNSRRRPSGACCSICASIRRCRTSIS
ncbi:hypothetical protein D3C83_44960 [compost metagenome]